MRSASGWSRAPPAPSMLALRFFSSIRSERDKYQARGSLPLYVPPYGGTTGSPRCDPPLGGRALPLPPRCLICASSLRSVVRGISTKHADRFLFMSLHTEGPRGAQDAIRLWVVARSPCPLDA